MTAITLLGPQTAQPTLGPVLASLGLAGPYCAVTAGWQEREGELDELEGHVAGQVVDLRLYGRTDELFNHDPALFAAHRARQDTLRELQRLYRIRLHHALAALRELMDARAQSRLLQQERRAAIAAVRTIDRHHLKRIAGMHSTFRQTHRADRRDALAQSRAELAEKIAGCSAVLIAGGHVAVLRNRMRLFDLGPLIADKPVIAWSAGAMALSERIVLFHDSPPHGAGDAEVLDEGIGLLKTVVPLPDARRRLNLGDKQRIALFARRFAPAECITLNPGAVLHRRAGRWTDARATACLTSRGGLREVAL